MSRSLPVCLVSLALWGSAVAGPGDLGPRPLSPERWDAELRDRGFDPQALPNPLGFTEEMRLEAQRVAGAGEPSLRLARLQAYLFRHGNPFEYEQLGTATAREAFEERSGDCVAFTSLFIALSRSVGIPTMPALVHGDTTETDGDLVMVNKHIVAFLDEGARGAVYDFYRVREAPVIGVRPIDDLFMAAIYQNNRGVLALKDGEFDQADAFFEAALRLQPSYVAAYSNLGVARRRRGDLFGALDAYLTGLQIEPKNDTVRDNLVHWLQLTRQGASVGREEAGGAFGAKLAAGDAAFSRGQQRRASRLYRQARQLEPMRPEPLVALARTDLLRGRLDSAASRLERAVEIAPDDEHARRLLEGIDRAREARGAAGPGRRVRATRMVIREAPISYN